MPIVNRCTSFDLTENEIKWLNLPSPKLIITLIDKKKRCFSFTLKKSYFIYIDILIKWRNNFFIFLYQRHPRPKSLVVGKYEIMFLYSGSDILAFSYYFINMDILYFIKNPYLSYVYFRVHCFVDVKLIYLFKKL